MPEILLFSIVKRAACLCLLFSLTVLSCDGGLTLPPDVEPGIVGTISIVSPWPPQDSVKTLWLFASQIYPIDSLKVAAGILNQQILLYPSLAETLPYNVDTQPFNFALPPGTYYYVGVLQRFGDNLFDPKSYNVVGMFHNPSIPDLPESIILHDFEIIGGINIDVDFYNLPPQPF